MTTAKTRKTSLENKHIRRCDYFGIIPLRLHSTMFGRSTLKLDWYARR